MASTSSSHEQNAFSGIEPVKRRRKIEQSSRMYDVFINHRGPDVKHTLATELYNSLEAVGISAFLDSEEMELGNSFPSAIETAIRSALVHVAIFSETYAESPWCLSELVLMLRTRAKIIPMFYEIKPSALRYIETGVYARPFHQYQEKSRYLDKIKKWKEALQCCSSLVGLEVGASSYHADCKYIVSAVEKEIQRMKYLHVAKYPVGLHELVKDFERRCLDELDQDFRSRDGTEKANVVGIFGFSGVGKTTLAKQFFNQNKYKFRRASFLFDVREASATGELPSLQSKLVKDIFKEDRTFRSSEEGAGYLRNRLARSRHLRFLIVLDDIDNVDQLDGLLVENVLNSSGNNLVIITTRQVGVLRSAGIDTSYHLRGLNREDGKELFCWYAFDQPHPSEGYEDLVEDFVYICGGLPLSLQVLGRRVYHRPQRYWEEELKRARKTPPGDIKQSLKIDFERLDDAEKQIFMDIACFFIDKSITTAMTIWKGSGWSGHGALKTLQQKGFVEENEIRYPNRLEYKWESSADGSVLRMQNHLQDMAREMADELSHPRRMWRSRDLKFLEQKGFQNILATQAKDIRCFHSFLDESMGCEVTFFVGEPGDGSDTSVLWLQLDYLGWPQPDLNVDINSIIPPWIPLQNLQCLMISNGSFQKLWHRYAQPPLQLRQLRITECFLGSSLPEEFCALQSLEILELSRCPMLSSLPSQFGNLSNLQHIDLADCGRLEKLPDSFKQLKRLKYLRLSCCWNLKLRLDMLKNFTELECLDLARCHELEELPRLDSLVPLQLRELRITECFRGSSLPEELCALESLEILELSCCPMLSSLPPRFGDLRNLRHVDLSNCGQLEELPVSFQRLSYLQFLKLSFCWKLKLRLDVLKDISKLEYLDLTRCHEVEELPRQITNQAHLTRLFVEGTSIRELPANIGELRNLEELRIGSPMLTSFPSSLENLSCLNTLLIDGCLQLVNLPESLSRLPLLKQLRIRASGLGELPFGAASSNIEVTVQQASDSNFNLTPIMTENCIQTIWNVLKTFWIERLTTKHGSLQTEFPSKLLAGIETLSLVANPQLMEIGILPRSLTILEICACKMLQNISGISVLVKLRKLEICSCPLLNELPSFADLASLQEFKIQGCPEVKTIQGLEKCRSLQILTAEVPPIHNLENLEEMRRVDLTSYTISALKPCILSTKDCPREVLVRGRVIQSVELIVDSLSSTNLNVLLLDKDSDWDNITQDLFNRAFLWYEEENESNNEESGSSSVNVSAQKVVHLAVCREGSSTFPEYCVGWKIGSNQNVQQRKAMLATGEDERVVRAFYKLIKLLE